MNVARELPDHAGELRRQLSDPREVCRLLGLEKGARAQQGGRGLHILCPAHDEKSPSCSITVGPDGTLRVRCFGCDLAGDVFVLIAAVHRLTLPREFPAALKVGADLCGTTLTGGANHAPSSPPPRAKSVAPPRPQLHLDAFDKLARLLLELCPLEGAKAIDLDGMSYLQDRAILQRAREDGWGSLPAEPAKLRSVIDDVLQEVGPDAWVLSGIGSSQTSMHHPQNRLLIPWRDSDGKIHTLQRRRLDDQKQAKYVFPMGRETLWPYGVKELRDQSDAPVILVEGAADCLAVRELDEWNGSRSVPLGLPGVTGWHSRWAALLQGRTVLIGFDADRAGDSGAWKVFNDLGASGHAQINRARPADGSKDWGQHIERRLARAFGRDT